MEIPTLVPMPAKHGPKLISDDDLCATCSKCQYKPGELSFCSVKWPCLIDSDGYIQECKQYQKSSKTGTLTVVEV